MKKATLTFRIVSISLVFATCILLLFFKWIHWDWILDLYLPLVIGLLIFKQVSLILEGKLGLSKITPILILATLMLGSFYHVQKHLLDMGNSNLLLGEYIVLSLVLLFDEDGLESAPFKSMGFILGGSFFAVLMDYGAILASRLELGIGPQFIISRLSIIELTLFVVIMGWSIHRRVMTKKKAFKFEDLFISSILVFSLAAIYNSTLSTNLNFEIIGVFLRWGVYLWVIDHTIKALESENSLAQEDHQHGFFESFSQNSHAFLLLRKSADGTYVVQRANHAALKLLKYSENDLQDKDVLDFIELSPEQVPLLDVLGSHLLKERVVRQSDQSEFCADIDVQTILINDVLFNVVDVRDVTERRAILKKIKIREAVFNSAIDAIMITDSQHRIIDVNPSFEKIYKYHHGDLIGKNPSIFKSGLLSDDFWTNMWHEIDGHGFFQDEFSNRTKDGELVTVLQSVTRITIEESGEIYYVSISTDISDKKKNESIIFNLAYRDPVTQFYNRSFLTLTDLNLDCEIAILVTLTDYKMMVGYYGKEKMDILMATVARKLEDFIDEGLFYQWSENQLLLFIKTLNSNCSSYEDMTNEMVNMASQTHLINGHQMPSKIAITWIEAKFLSNDINRDVNRLEVALNHALKNNLHNVKYSVELEEKLERNRQIQILLKDAIMNHEFYVLYQPIMDLEKNKLCGIEALARWQSPTLGVVHPLEFIPVAEKNLLIHDLGNYVALQAMSTFSKLGLQDLDVFLTFNVSSIQLLDKRFFEHISKIACDLEISTEHIVLEITESEDLFGMVSVLDNLESFRKAGFGIAIDDFGTGFSSLSRIKELRPDYIKIDKLFFDEIETSIKSTLLTNAVIAFSNQMGYQIIAEGIESAEQIIYIRNQNIRYVQGFVFSYPLSVEQLQWFLTQTVNVDELLLESFNDDQKLLDNYELKDKLFTQSIKKVSYVELLPNMTVIGCSRSLVELIGLEMKEFMGQNFVNFLVDQELESCIKKLFDEKKMQSCLNKIRTSQGKEVNVIMNIELNNNKQNDIESISCWIEDLTEQTRSIENYVMRQESLGKFFDRSPLPNIVWKSDLSIVVANEQAKKILTHPRTGKILNLDELFPSERTESFNKHYDHVFAGYPQESRIDIVDGAGQKLEMHWFSTPIFDEDRKVTQIVTVLQDETELNKQTETARILSDAAQISDRFIIFTDVSHCIKFANRKTIEILKLEAYGQRDYYLSDLPIAFVNKASAIIELNNMGLEPWNGIVHLQDEHGNTKALEAYREGSVLDDLKGVRGFLYDFKEPETKDAERIELETLHRALIEQERLVSMGKLIAGIAHEINNPLSYLIGNTDYLLKSVGQIKEALKDQPELYDDLVDIFNSFGEGLNVVKTIVHDLKNYSTRNTSQERGYCDLNELIHQTLRIAHNEIKYNSIVKSELDETLPKIWINGPKIQQVILNLIINANHAISSKWVHEMGAIHIKTYEQGEEIICSVQDNGTGMDSETLAHIFEAFYTTKEKGVGTGLGLSVSKEIIETFHSGVLEVESVLGEGTRFIIHLPINVEVMSDDEF